ncbi:ATP-binding protein [Streptomyces sp. NPDC007157]|uniref:ATP-binding protein n=1 Tax=Streptomyces sp. NPDC007157 TaxID=3154681 RepID=UPI0034034D46
MIEHPSRHCSVELQALPARIGQVRRIVSAQLRYWRLDPLIDRAALGVTELLTNVHRHAQPDKNCTVEIELQLDRLTVSVRDHDPRLPVVEDGTDVAPMATCGRGLAMVAAVSESWGVRPHDDGKVVWFTLPAPTATPKAAHPQRRTTEPAPRHVVAAGAAATGAPAGHATVGATATAQVGASASAAAHMADGAPAAVPATAGPSAAVPATAGAPDTAHAPARSAVAS